LIWKEELKRHLWRIRETEEFVVLKKLVNFPLKNQKPGYEVGKFLRQLGLELRGRKREGKYYFTDKAIKKLSKRRLAFKCDFCGCECYAELAENQDLKEGSPTIITHKGDTGEKDKKCYCPVCDTQKRRIGFNNTLDPWTLKKKVAFTAKPVKYDYQGNEIDDREGFHGRGMMEAGPLYDVKD